MASSWCKETPEKINYTKLCRLLVDGGTQAVRSVFDGIHPPSSLTAILNANKTTLQKLKKPKGKVLNNEQWDKLYPPSGINPTSKDFDITLLFVLLRNICRLTPPVCEITSTRKRKRSWDELPHKTDNSLEANLVRIKYFRNNTIAHKSNTEINDVEFEQNWQDISSALLSLGLNQEHIDDLKSARLGEKDYNQLLYDWYISDEDIKTQLEDLKSNMTDIKSATTHIKSDTTDIKSDTTDIKSDTTHIKSDTTDIKSDTTDIKSDTTGIKSDTTGIKSDTTGIKSDMTGIKSDTTGIKSDTTGIKSDTTGIKSDTAAIKNGVDDLKIMYAEAHKQAKHIDKLAVSDFKPEISTRCKSFHPNTRQWILDQVKSHVDSDQPESCIMQITAGPGMGKSTIAAKICEMYKNLGCLGGCHFFQFSNTIRSNSRLMLQSIARQMCDTVPGYQEALERKLQTDLGKKITEMNCEELLTILFEEPLCNLEQTDANFVVVIDALDECSYDLKNELMTALRNKLSRLPSWLRFIITTRPSTNTSVLGPMAAVEINPEDKSNLHDLANFFCFELKALYPQYNNEYLVQELVQMTKGLFLVAFFVIDFLKSGNVTSPSKVLELFPNGISSVYENYFSRLKEVLLPYISEEERFYKMLDAIAATKNPLPKNMFYNILVLKSERDVPRTKKQARKDALNSLHSVFPVENDHVTVFHKSVVDWLILERDEEHEFSVRVEDGNEVLANQCYDVLSDIRNGNKDLDKPLELTDIEEYALRFGWQLIKESSTISETEKNGILSDLYILTAFISENTKYPRPIYDTRRFTPLGLFYQIFQFSEKLFATGGNHTQICPFRHRLPFGRCLEFVLQTAYVIGGTEKPIPMPLDDLIKYNLPYCNVKTVLELPPVFKDGNYSPPIYVHEHVNGFISFHHSILIVPSKTMVYTHCHDGKCTGEKCFIGNKKQQMSPDNQFIVFTEHKGNTIEIVNVQTLELVNEYASPHDDIQTCHVFGDDHCWYIVIKCCIDNKVYVMEGLTGLLHNTLTVEEDDEVKDVSSLGHILITNTWKEVVTATTVTLTDEEVNNVKIMNWKESPAVFSNKRRYHDISNRPLGHQCQKAYQGHDQEMTFRLMNLRHYVDVDLQIPISPVIERVCHCSSIDHGNLGYQPVQFTPDGLLLAYHYKDFIYIVNTLDGTLFKRVFLGSISSHNIHNILFLSETYLLIYDFSSLFLINVQTNEIEYRFCIPQNLGKLFIPLFRRDGKPFRLHATDFPSYSCVFQYEFKNLFV